MEFRVLGPLELWGPGDTKINLASGAQRRLTSFLVQRANTIVPAETLEEHLGLTPGALRTSVSRLRRLVGFDTLITAPPGYTLRTDRIDATQFDALVALARARPTTGRRAMPSQRRSRSGAVTPTGSSRTRNGRRPRSLVSQTFGPVPSKTWLR